MRNADIQTLRFEMGCFSLLQEFAVSAYCTGHAVKKTDQGPRAQNAAPTFRELY